MVASTPSLQLVVGLGNPGPQYERTRHNAGFWFVDELAAQYSGALRLDTRFGGEHCQISQAGHPLRLFKPMAFMNRSGQPIVRFAAYYRIPPPAILVVHDDMDLPPGTVRLKRAGGHGGHNGLRDIISQLGRNDFLRLRFGVGHSRSDGEAINHVLNRAPRDEQRLIDEALTDSLSAFPMIVQGDLQKAMQVLHSRRPLEADIAPSSPSVEEG